jgi:nicotinate-nucleotide adenylyltransferase
MGLTPQSTGVRRIGVFGGSFDPPHLGHMALAQAAVADLQLDELRILPTGHAWHKNRALTPAVHRLAMARLAFTDLPQAVVDDREIKRAGPTYTVDTLRELRADFPDAEMMLIIGEDQAHALPTWHEWREILRLAIICVAEREDLTGARPRFVAPTSYESRFIRLKMPLLPISATDIRSRIAAHQSIVSLVFEPVARYIDDHHLYQTT